jgi:hypothetical protein
MKGVYGQVGGFLRERPQIGQSWVKRSLAVMAGCLALVCRALKETSSVFHFTLR